MKHLVTALALGFATLSFAEDAKFDVDGLSFTAPAGWKSIEVTSPMRKAVLQVSVPGLEAPLDVIFFHFGGGDVDANVQRWKGQLSGQVDVKTEEIEAGGKKITIFVGTGTFTDGMSGKGPQENYALTGALIPVEGSGPVVIKLAGPKAATLNLLDTLKKLATSPFTK